MRRLHADPPSFQLFLPLPKDGADIAGALDSLPDPVNAVFCRDRPLSQHLMSLAEKYLVFDLP